MQSPSSFPKLPAVSLNSNVKKELKKILPSGASKTKRYTEPNIPDKRQNILEKRRFTLDDQMKYMNPALTMYLEEHFNIDDVQKSPFIIPKTLKKQSTSPRIPKCPYSLTPERSPEVFLRQSTKKINEETNNIPIKSSNERDAVNTEKIQKINGILDACDEVKSPKNLISRSNVKKLSEFFKKVINDIDDVLIATPESLQDQRKNHDTGMKEYQAKEVLRKLVRGEKEKRRFSMIKPRALSERSRVE